ATGNAIGGPAGGNIISGNNLGAVSLGTGGWGGASGNWVQYNIFGLNSSQSAVVGSQDGGIIIQLESHANVVQGNAIAGHVHNGIVVANSISNYIQGNWIGESSSLTTFANGGFGIYLLPGASYNFLVSNNFGTNTLGSLYVDPAAVGNVIQ